MSEHKPEWPEFGELVIATIEKVTDYGAYAKLEEYNKQGLLHISEIANARIRRIRDYVKENQKMVLKVIRVNVEKGQINLSLRRVTRRERIEKNKSWKKRRKAEGLLKEVAEKAGLPIQEVYQKAGVILEEKYGLYEGFEEVVKEGIDVLTKLDIPEDLVKVIAQVAEERIKVKMVKVTGVIEVRCSKPNGVKCIQAAFIGAEKSHRAKDIKIKFHVIAAPKYGVEVSADNWKRAEKLFEKVCESVVTNITEAGGQGSFERTK
jgi:translation initiation factor 2 subunit 1